MAIPPASALRSLLQSQTRQSSKRFLSTAHQSTRRPLPPASQQRWNSRSPLPLVQRRCKSRTVEEAKSRYRTGPFSWKAGLLFVLVGGGLVWYFEHEKQRMQRKRIAEATKGVGKPKVGGDFQLVDQEGRPFSSNDLKGRHSLVSFPHPWLPFSDPDRPGLGEARRLGQPVKPGANEELPRARRSTSDSHIAPTYAPRSSTRWLVCSTWSRPSAPVP